TGIDAYGEARPRSAGTNESRKGDLDAPGQVAVPLFDRSVGTLDATNRSRNGFSVASASDLLDLASGTASIVNICDLPVLQRALWRVLIEELTARLAAGRSPIRALAFDLVAPVNQDGFAHRYCCNVGILIASALVMVDERPNAATKNNISVHAAVSPGDQ